MDTWPIILSNHTMLTKLITLMFGTYPVEDGYYRHFHKVIEEHPVELIRQHWDENDVRQEIYLRWHKTILKYYSPDGLRARKRKRTLSSTLFEVGLLHLAHKLKKFLRDLEASTHYVETAHLPSRTPIILTDILPRSIAGGSHFKLMSTMEGRVKLFLYRLIIEDRDLKELKEEFGSWEEICKIMDELKKIFQ